MWCNGCIAALEAGGSRFDPYHPDLEILVRFCSLTKTAKMRVWLELVDAADLESVEGNLVEVRLLSFAPREKLGFESLLITFG